MRCSEETAERYARLMAGVLQGRVRLSPRDAEKDRSVWEIVKSISKKYPLNLGVKVFKKEFLAFKLGIPSKALDEKINPGFEQFAESVHLARYLIIFNHALQVAENGKLTIRHQGKMEPWETVREIALAPPPPLKDSLPKLYNPPLKYGADGVKNSNFYNWTELTPFMRVEGHSWGAHYILEICCLCTGKFRCLGDHTWIRLKTPEGDVYAPGLYREDNDKSTAFTLKAGRLQHPDISEFWPETIHTISHVITQEAFCNIKAQVEADHKGNGVVFHVVSKNCTAYALGLARIAGIDISAKMRCVDNFIPTRIQPYVPRWSYRLSSFIFNLGQVALGGTKVSHTLPKEEKPPIRSLWDLLKIPTMESPYILAFATPSQR